MSKKFLGTADEFKQAINSIIPRGNWTETKGKLSFRTVDGAIINWFQSTGTIQVQGNSAAKSKCEEKLGHLNFEKLYETKPESFDATVKEQVKTIGKNTKIFVVHGHDTTSREQLELILHRLGLDPFVLMNTSGDGLTIIEALEREIGKGGASKFGIVLLTPDDFGYSKIDGEGKVQPRARQNVVLEMGMLISAIGRSNVVILKKGHLEIPSDASGIVYLSFNDHVKEIVGKLVERLRNSGFEIKQGRISKAMA